MNQNNRNKKPNNTLLYMLLGGIAALLIFLWGWIRTAVQDYKFLNGFIPKNLFLKVDTAMSGLHLKLSTLNGSQHASQSLATYETIDEKQLTAQDAPADVLAQAQKMAGKENNISGVLPFLGLGV